MVAGVSNSSYKASLILAAVLCLPTAWTASALEPHPSERFGAVLYQDDFREGLAQWHVELERPGKITAQLGVLEIDVPGGATLWFKQPLQGPVAIEFQATAIKAGGRNDRLSDLNCFWMANNRDASEPVFARRRNGRFEQYDDLVGYFVSLGGNDNTRSQFLRYTGEAAARPLTSEHELATNDALLPANRSQTITLIASGKQIEYWRNARRLFEFSDPEPLRAGWFALRTNQSHLKITRLRIYALNPAQ